MNALKRKKDFVLVGLLMAVLALVFLIYIGKSLCHSSKHWIENSIEYVDQPEPDEETHS